MRSCLMLCRRCRARMASASSGMRGIVRQWLKRNATGCASRKSPRHTVIASRATPPLASQISRHQASMLLLSSRRRAIQQMAMSTTWRRQSGYLTHQTQAARRPSLGGNQCQICATRSTSCLKVHRFQRRFERHLAASPRRRREVHSRRHLASRPLNVWQVQLRDRPQQLQRIKYSSSNSHQRPCPSGK